MVVGNDVDVPNTPLGHLGDPFNPPRQGLGLGPLDPVLADAVMTADQPYVRLSIGRIERAPVKFRNIVQIV